MNDMIVPNWHPIIVHFSVALLVTATVMLVIAAIRGKTNPSERLRFTCRRYWMITLVMSWLGSSVPA